MKTIIATALTCAVSAIHPTGFKFMQYLSQQGKSYKTIEEFSMRLENFEKTDSFIHEWNANKEHTSSVGHNFLSDWTVEEKKKLTGGIRDESLAEAPLHPFDENSSVPASVDWVASGNVTDVLD